MKTAQKPTLVRTQYGEGSYLTDGRRLAEVRRVLEHGLVVEEGSVEAPDVTVLLWNDLEQGDWRPVEPEAAGGA